MLRELGLQLNRLGVPVIVTSFNEDTEYTQAERSHRTLLESLLIRIAWAAAAVMQ